MLLKSVETTPNPNSMKLNLNEQLGAAITYTSENNSGCPEFVRALLRIGGLQSVFVCNDFLTLNKDPSSDWREILEKATTLLGGETAEGPSIQAQRKAAEKEGQTQILVQTFRGIPIQVKVVDSEGETRVSLGDRFNEAAQFVQAKIGADYLKERYWADHGVRYGARADIANEIAEEIQGTFDEDTLEQTKAQALGTAEAAGISLDILKKWLRDEDWHKRLKALQELSPSEESLPLIAVALKDSNPQVRRLAAAALGATGSTMAIESLCDAMLNDQSVGVRRTAGDALSDIGDPNAEPAVCRALKDSNKLVRWRAARFLSDVGTQESLPHLEGAADDPEFEVRLEIESAMQRIRGGTEGLGPVWKRIMEQKG
jgi:hypothetical protein